MSHLALERNERTRTRTETQRGEVEQPHTQSFGHKSRANFKFGREKDPEDPSMDCKPSGIRRTGVLARGGTWAEARPTRRGHTVPWAGRAPPRHMRPGESLGEGMCQNPPPNRPCTPPAERYDTACWAPRLSLSQYTLSLSNETAVDFVQRERPLHVHLRVQSTVEYVAQEPSTCI